MDLLKRKTKRPLTNKQQRFVEEFVIYYNGTKAAINAGYPRPSAGQVAYENLRKPHVREAVDHAIQKQNTDTNLDRDALIAELLILAFARIGILSSAFSRWSRLPGKVRQRGGASSFETNVIDCRRRLKSIVYLWRNLTLEQTTSIAGRFHVEHAIRLSELVKTT